MARGHQDQTIVSSARSESPQWLCELCYPDAADKGLLFDEESFYLFTDEAGLHFCDGQGHRDEALIVFTEAPPRCPADDASDEQWRAFEEFADRYLPFSFEPEVGYRLVEAARQAGFDRVRDGRFDWWLIDHIAAKLES